MKSSLYAEEPIAGSTASRSSAAVLRNYIDPFSAADGGEELAMDFDDPMDDHFWDEFLDPDHFDCPGCGSRLGREQTHVDEEAQCEMFTCPTCRMVGRLE